MKKWIVGALLLLAVTGQAFAKSSWESLKSEPVNLKTVVQESDVELKTSSGVIVITTPRPVQVQVFTILGQQVSSETVGPGIVRLQVNAHGVYIIKLGDKTCKIAL